MRTSNQIFSVIYRNRKETLEFNAVIVFAEENTQGNVYLTYKPVGGKDFDRCGLWGTATVDKQGRPINFKTQKPSEWGHTFKRTNRVHTESCHWSPKPGNTAYDLMC